MKAETRKTIQIIVVAGLLVAAVRLAIVLYQRHEANRPAEAVRELPLDPDYYVTPRKLHAYDLASARELTKQPAWVREGYRYYYYPYDPARHQADLKHEAGLLGPIEKLDITDVVSQSTPGSPKEKQVLAVFGKGDRRYALPVGVEQDGNYTIVSDEILYIQDPRQLYHYWPKAVWEAVNAHQIKLGMNEIQACFALGMGIPRPSMGNEKVVQYPNGGNAMVVTYRNGQAVDIHPGGSK